MMGFLLHIGFGGKNMTIERKQFVEKIQKKKVEKVDSKKVKRGFKPDSLQDAIVDGKFVGQVGNEIIVDRFRNGKQAFHVCTVKELEENGLIHTWDETIHQWFVFSTNEAPKVVKLLSSGKK